MMNGRRRYIVLFLPIVLSVFVLPYAVSAQAIDNTVSFRNINSDHYFRINYENDFFSGTDRDYTQGIYIEKIHPIIKKFPLTKLLWHPGNSRSIYGLAIEDDSYTPNHLDNPAILYGDRPYADALFLKTFLTAINASRRERISTMISTGVIGPAAGGEGMQKAIHHWINYIQPLGWHNQIGNDAVLNYQLNYERELFSEKNWLSLSAYNSLRLGTLSSRAATGLTLMAGNFHSPFENDSEKPDPGKCDPGKSDPDKGRPDKPAGDNRGRKWQWYVYGQPLVNFVGYDATLQGGLFNHSSPYTLPGHDIERVTLGYKYGLILILKKLYLEYYQTGLTREFNTSVFHHTGGLQIGFAF
jgi:hypothetical protein